MHFQLRGCEFDFLPLDVILKKKEKREERLQQSKELKVKYISERSN